MNIKKNTVYLVGAGSGDPDLLTIKAKKLIDAAEVILYDNLVGEEIIQSINIHTEKINVGKQASNHTLTQSEINKLLIKKSKEGKLTIRLKGGDPFVFGRGGEEAGDLISEGINFEVVPGITSGIAVPASFNIPVTHRKYASCVTFITGNEDPTKKDTSIKWEFVSKLNGTIVIYMGIGMLEKNINELLKYGKNPKTPIAIIENGTRNKSRITIGALDTIVNISIKQEIKPPAIIVIGDVVQFHEILRYL